MRFGNLIDLLAVLPKVARSTTYWSLLVWLLFVVGIYVLETVDYYQDIETYRLLYPYPERLEAIGWVILTLYAIALMVQARAWRTRRISSVVVGVVLLHFAFDWVNVHFRLNPAFNGANWSTVPLPL